MTQDQSKSPFQKLDTSLLRSTATPPTQQNQEIKKSRNLDIKKSKRTFFQKVNYRLSPDAVNHLEDIVRDLKRKFGIKALREEIVEEAIEAAYKDLLENQDQSKLVKIFSRNQEIKKS